jgi:thioredoxin-like negative regulator of GroEL
MTSMLLSVIMHAAILATGADATPAAADTYAEAHRTTTRTGKPMVVMVSTEWCAPCQMMKKTIMPRVREHGLLKKVAFAMVNPDRDHDLAEKLTGGGPIPQLVMFRRTADGWARKKLVGGQSVETVEEFINEGLADDKAERKSKADASESSDKPSPRSQRTTTTDEGGASDEDTAQHG